MALLDRYEAYMTLPIDSPRYHQVGEGTEAALAVLDGAVTASLDIDSGVVSLVADRDVQLEVTGVEEVEGIRKHGIAHYLDLCTARSVDVSPMLTHRYRLDEWREAFTTIIDQGETGAIKVALDFR